MSRTFFHCCSSENEPEELLDPSEQYSEAWGAPDHGPCDKCGGSGEAGYECLSCLEEGARGDCPACQGRIRFRDTCPACEGSGAITRTRRSGVAAFSTRGGLHRYLATKDANVDGRLMVELVGELSDDRDLDADQGALLIRPTRIVSIEPIDPEQVASIRSRLAEEPPT